MKKKETRVEYWKTPKNPALIANMEFSLESMNAFMKFKPEKLDSTGMHAMRSSYASFLFGKTSASKNESATLDFWKVLDKNREEISLLQRHLQSRIGSIINEEISSDTPMFSIPGTLNISISPSSENFIEEFQASQNSKTAVDSVDLEKNIIDMRLIKIIRELRLPPNRFKKCSKCQSYFVQTSARDKTYCSKQCAGAVRQANYLKDKILVKKEFRKKNTE